MVIKWGEPWGEPGVRPPEAVVAGSDHELASLAAAAHSRGEPLVAGVGAGDVLTTLGVEPERPPADHHYYPFDLGVASLDGAEPVPFVASVIARRWGWSGQIAVVMNVGWYRNWYLGPRAHPNDGLLDITVGQLPLRQRLLARSRATSGSHLPHPRLRTLRRGRWDHVFDRPTPVLLDGRSVGRHRTLEVSVIPNCFTLVV
ncbi:MAG: hypothetical protein GY724_06930 [Actinomycetia bacterium]|nr:hypothetical protein [Actinomycetes bacterium]MCP4224804.1 hypothetical protein [Actinomycetes bacterium]MCP5033455.1 hypothetical protein [Actinomycetes bacterium]